MECGATPQWLLIQAPDAAPEHRVEIKDQYRLKTKLNSGSSSACFTFYLLKQTVIMFDLKFGQIIHVISFILAHSKT